jgi:multicomponent Na+:H+ antiporter subunit D
MIQQLPAIIVVFPLLLSFFIFMAGWWNKKLCFPLAVFALAGCVPSSVAILVNVINQGPIHYWLGGWPPPWGIEYMVDHLNALMLVLVSSLSLLVAISTKRNVETELPEKIPSFWSLYVLLITGLLGITVTGDMFNLFVLLEVASLTAYALIAMGEKHATYASFRYIVIGTVGASWYLLGIGYLYIVTGSLNMTNLSQILPDLYQSKAVMVGFAFILLGVCIKMALFPLHVWLPDAYTQAPSAVSATIAPLMTKVMAYVLIRVLFTVFKPEYPIQNLHATDILSWIGTIAILFGGIMALSQSDFKKMLCYIMVAEIGYIVGGIGIANATALKGAIFHIINDAIMVACLFLVASMVMYKTKGHQISNFKGIFRKMPYSAAIFTVGALAVIGVPPTCGFFSKWYLLLGGIQANHWAFVIALLIATLINVALFFRIFDVGLYLHAFQHEPESDGMASSLQSHEAPLIMLIPAAMIAIAIIVIGIFNQTIVNNIIKFAVPMGL